MNELFKKLEKVEKVLREQKEVLEKTHADTKIKSRPHDKSKGLAGVSGKEKAGSKKALIALKDKESQKISTPDKMPKEKLKKSELIEALSDAGFRQSALLLKNWDTLDTRAKEFQESLSK